MTMTWVISLLIFTMVLLASVGLYQILGSREAMKVIKRRADGQIGASAPDSESVTLSFKNKLDALLTRLGEANKPTDVEEVSSRWVS